MACSVLEQGRRSSILLHETGNLTRLYHDTGFETPLPFSIDEKGVMRISGNRALRSLCRSEAKYRGASRDDAPPCVRRAIRAFLEHSPNSTAGLAALLGVKESTAWCYLCRAVEFYPSLNVNVSVLVFPPLLEALATVDHTGSLKQVMGRVNDGPLKGSTEWKCMENRFGHLRLARLCIMPE